MLPENGLLLKFYPADQQLVIYLQMRNGFSKVGEWLDYAELRLTKPANKAGAWAKIISLAILILTSVSRKQFTHVTDLQGSYVDLIKIVRSVEGEGAHWALM